MARIKEGDDIGAEFLNRHEEVAEWYFRTKAQGETGAPLATPINNVTVLVRNNTGGDLRRGEVIELNGGLLTQQDPRYLPFAGATPNASRVGWGITLQQIPSGSMNDCLLLGVCIAFINVTDGDHEYADRVSGSTVLQSAARGPVKILQVMSETSGSPGEFECVVQLADYAGDYVDAVQVFHSDKDPYVSVEANANGVHPGNIKRVINEVMTDLGPCWILFIDRFDEYAGDVPALNADYYGPARYSGTYTVDGLTLDLLVVRRGAEDDIIHFELLSELDLREPTSGTAEHAKAEILNWNGTAWTGSGKEIEVYDWFGNEGMWSGLTGYRGWAKKRPGTYNDPGEDEEDPEDDEIREVYEIIWMERIAQKIRFTSTEYMGQSISGRMTVDVDWFDHQGKDPGNSVAVFDPQGRCPDAFSGTEGTAYYNNRGKRYEVDDCLRVFIYGAANLAADLCGDSSIAITGFTGKPVGMFVGDPPTAPTTAAVPCVHGGLSGDVVNLRRVSNGMPESSWEVIDVSKHQVDLVTNVSFDGELLKQAKRPFYIEYCDDNVTDSTIDATVDCDEEEE